MMNWYLKVLKKYTDFSGRASRREFWMFIFFNLIFATIGMLLDNVSGIAIEGILVGPIFGLLILALLIPTLAVTVRRLHDVGKSGRLISIALIPLAGAIWLLVLFCMGSEPNENKYGANPHNTETVDSMAGQLIFIYIILAFSSRIFYTIFPKINAGLYRSIFDVTNESLTLLLGIIPLALAFSIKSHLLKIIALILGIILFLYSMYGLVLQAIK